MKRLGRRLAVVLLIGIQGCAVGPDYRPPELTMPGAWAQRDQVGVTSAPADLAAWWRGFRDPVLDTLIDRAIAKNLDLKIALANVREARALRGVAGADQFPAVNASGAYARVKDSENARPLPPGFDPEHHLFLVGLDASWELDIWGRVRRSVEAAGATLEATEDNRRDVQVIVLAEVARNLVEVRSAQQRLLIAQDNIRASRRWLTSRAPGSTPDSPRTSRFRRRARYWPRRRRKFPHCRRRGTRRSTAWPCSSPMRLPIS